jgi:hypothetical protein
MSKNKNASPGDGPVLIMAILVVALLVMLFA